jgi:hypothetical protein
MELQNLEQRLRYVEQSVKFWRRLSLLFMACCVATLIVGWSAKDQILRIARIEAEEIWLRDDKGVYKSQMDNQCWPIIIRLCHGLAKTRTIC